MMLSPDDLKGACIVIGICCVIYLAWYVITGGNDAD